MKAKEEGPGQEDGIASTTPEAAPSECLLKSHWMNWISWPSLGQSQTGGNEFAEYPLEQKRGVLLPGREWEMNTG